ncbi:MAG TPA: hypothetical protein DCE33_15055, partial [Rhodospirillaceae bacterium]|nr:hypothetical protein [Rhodospirillaceae bacterium]
MAELLKIPEENSARETVSAGEPTPSWLQRLRNAWRDMAGSLSGNVRPDLSNDNDVRNLRKQMMDCLEARGGEVSARARAASLGETYLGLDLDGRRRFL